mmetsp:Transcript_16110/g.40596  ORF Transcript_16110/g.40596 Transcript_16110/m.40596 type:complete len:154 (+) Transcript_16110:35-496(+)|eukprot:CAMPEP_0173419076 /NCGR_PEP_ID=MMETSP1357-20121228/1048_1 /TAXON_ID=77926 /ORGANISM="Hemiselmis rufescens, Strain PCC563" /LENGTH=153 /DNA_ID=CAMNT_0014381659 /DNA_START=8 /DNA_END=469 /DNA_ORIENTATION=-
MEDQTFLIRPVEQREQRNARKQQIAAAFGVIMLGCVAAAMIISPATTSSDLRGPEDSILNILSPQERAALAVAAARETSLVLGPGQEQTDGQAIQAAWATFKDSKDEAVIKELEAWDPKKEEEKVEEAITDMKTLGLETAAEAKILKKFLKPE